LRWKTIALGCWGLAFLLSAPAEATSSHGANCVAYARAMTGIQIDGNAGMWWSHAAGRYERGQEPKIGAILAFRSSGRMRSGHVAVVTGIMGPREILVDHANWVRGRVSRAMLAVDTSPRNDWTSVRVVEARAEARGARDNPTFGFIYPRTLPAGFEEANTDSSDARHARIRVAHDHAKAQHERVQLADAKADPDKSADDVKPAHLKHAKHHAKEDAKLAYVY
jgi:surface antigen